MDRCFFFFSIASSILCFCLCGCTTPEKPASAIRGETLQRYYLAQFRKNFQNYRSAIDKASSEADALRLVKKAQARVKKAFTFPIEKSPLNAKSYGKVDCGRFVIEKVSFQSRKNFTVSANFYLPSEFTAPLPAVLIFCGHSRSGKYWYGKTIAATLAAEGYAVLVIDPFHQGERMQFDKLGLTVGHNVINRHLLLLGEDFASWRVWDGLRAIEYLRSRKETDPKRIALSGTSGGGTLASLTGACSDVVSAVAPSCYITTFYHNVRNELFTDAEQNPPGILSGGGEMADFLIARAPRPTAIIAQKHDFFDFDGAQETYRMVQKVYRLLGAEKNIRLIEGPGPHTFESVARQGLHAFLDTHLRKGTKTPAITAVKKFPPRQELQITECGSVFEFPQEENVCAFAVKKMAELRRKRAQNPLPLKEIQKQVRKLLLLPSDLPVPEHHSLRAIRNHDDFRKYTPFISRFSVNTAPGMDVILHAAKYDFVLSSQKQAIIYLPERDSRAEMNKVFPLPQDCSLFALDYRGVGELTSASGTPGIDAYSDYSTDYHFAALSLLTGGSMISGRVRDILSVVNLLRSRGAKEITLYAAPFSHAPAIFAALLAEKPVKLVLDGKFVSYEDASRNDFENPYPQSNIPRGILKIADLDELLLYCNQRHKEK